MHHHASSALHVPLLTSSLSSPGYTISSYSNRVPSPRTCGAKFNESGKHSLCDSKQKSIYIGYLICFGRIRFEHQKSSSPPTNATASSSIVGGLRSLDDYSRYLRIAHGNIGVYRHASLTATTNQHAILLSQLQQFSDDCSLLPTPTELRLDNVDQHRVYQRNRGISLNLNAIDRRDWSPVRSAGAIEDQSKYI